MKQKKLPSKHSQEALVDNKGVYIISVIEPFCLSYPRGSSNIIYIGRGNTWNRLNQGHAKWIVPLSKRLGLRFKINFGMPRVQKTADAFKHVEGDLIRIFVNKYGQFPYMNKQDARETRSYEYSDNVLAIIKNDISESYLASLSIHMSHAFLVSELPEV